MEETFKDSSTSIGEELDEAFLFQDNHSAGSSVSSSVNSHSSEKTSKSRSGGPKGFHKFWPITSRNKADKDVMSQSVLVNPNPQQSQPKFKCQISAPSTPINNTTVASSWTYGINIPLKHNSSFGSVDEEDEKTPSKLELVESPKRSKSRLSLNLVGKEKSASPRSPRKISKMIRSSFSRLLQLNGNENDNNPETTTSTTTTPSDMPRGPSMNSINSSSEHYLVNNNQELDNNSVMTPSTLAYLEEAKQEGLPVIPFQYPTCVLIDKMKRKNPVMTTDEVKANNPTKKAVKYDVQDWEEDFPEPKSPPGTLESIVDLAQKQLLKEDLDLEEEDFICGSIGSMSLCSNSNSRPRSRIVQANWEQAAEASLFMDEMDSKSWHDYLDMKKRDSLNSRSNPIRIKEKQY